jgi:hypothetical protein
LPGSSDSGTCQGHEPDLGLCGCQQVDPSRRIKGKCVLLELTPDRNADDDMVRLGVVNYSTSTATVLFFAELTRRISELVTH